MLWLLPLKLVISPVALNMALLARLLAPPSALLALPLLAPPLREPPAKLLPSAKAN